MENTNTNEKNLNPLVIARDGEQLDLCTYYDGCDLTLRYDGDTAHFELWIPGEATPEPIATLPAIGGELEWAPTADDLLNVSYAEDLQHLIDSFAALRGDRRRYELSRKWCVWEVSYADDDEDDENDPLVIARDGEQLDLATYRDDRRAGFVGWRIHWDGDQLSAPSPADAPEVYYLVETCSQQYSKECGAPTYGTQVWRVHRLPSYDHVPLARGEVTHDAWFAWGSSDPAKAVKELCDVYVVAGEDGEAALPPVDIDSLRVVRAIESSCCYLVY